MTNDPALDAQLINDVASQQLGAQPVDAAAAAAQLQQPQQPPAPPKAPKGDTASDKVQTAASPNTEGKTATQEPVSYKVTINGQERTLTPEQIAQTTQRYADLNYKHQTEVAPIKPAIDILNRIVAEAKAQGTDLSGDQLAQFLSQSLLAQANSHNPAMGSGVPSGPNATVSQAQSSTDFDSQLSQWEADNAVTLPPAYKNMATQMSTLATQNQQMQEMMRGLVGHMQGVATASQNQAQQGSNAQASAYQQAIANNLNRAQQKHQLPDEVANDFLMFAGERGYSIEDFIDGSLADRAVADFVAVRSTPEMDRLRQINQKRQAFTGVTTPGAPGNGAAPPQAPNADEQFLNSMAEQTLRNRNLLS